MYLPKKLYELLSNLGYKDTNNIAEFWFSNRDRIAIKVRENFSEVMMQKFENQIRWKSEIGIECQKQVRTYLEEKVRHIHELHNIAYRENSTVLNEAKTINFSDFRFTYDDNTYTLDDFQNLYANAKIYPSINLMGINLEGISINHCVIENVCFADANLANSSIGSVIFKKSTLTRAILINAKLGQIRFIDGSLDAANLTGAYLNVVKIDNNSVSSSFKYSNIYIYLNVYCIVFFQKTTFMKKIQINMNIQFLYLMTQQEQQIHITYHSKTILTGINIFLCNSELLRLCQ